MRALIPIAAAAALLLISACSLLLPERSAEEQPAVLEHYGDPARVSVPDSARAGEPFTVELASYGGGCVRKGRTDVANEGMTADIRPFDYHNTARNVVCTAELSLYRHDVTVRFDRPGTATIRVHGRRMPNGEPVVITRTVVIR